MDDNYLPKSTVKTPSKSEAEAKLERAISGKKPTTKEEALEVLRAFAAAGRMRSPSSGTGM